MARASQIKLGYTSRPELALRLINSRLDLVAVLTQQLTSFCSHSSKRSQQSCTLDLAEFAANDSPVMEFGQSLVSNRDRQTLEREQ